MTTLSRGNTVLLLESRTIATAQHSTRIRAQMFQILEALMQSRKRLSKQQLTDLLWGEKPDGCGEEAVRVIVSQVRRVLKEIGSDIRISHIHDLGYRIEEEWNEREVRSYSADQLAALARIIDLVRPQAPELVAQLEAA